MSLHFAVLFFMLVGTIAIKAEIFTSTEAFRSIFDVRRNIADELERYIEAENARLKKIESMVTGLEKFLVAADSEVDKFLDNPVYVFLYIKNFGRQNNDNLLSLMSNALNLQETGKWVDLLVENLPKNEDVIGSTLAILRLQDTYKITPAEFADGRLPGVTPTDATRLSAKDCFDIAVVAYERNDHEHSLLWMGEAFNRSQSEPGVDRATILGYTSYSNYMLGNLEEALKQADNLIALDPNHVQARKNRKYFARVLKQKEGENTKKPAEALTGAKEQAPVIGTGGFFKRSST